MRNGLLAILALLLLPAPAVAQVENCFDCVLGIFDDRALASCSGTVEAGIPKDIYVGIRFDAAGRFTSLSGIEFSIAGLGSDILLTWDWPGLGYDYTGAPPAPADTSATSTGSGGMQIMWPGSCPSGSQALALFTIISFRPLADRVLQIKRRYQVAASGWRTPVFLQCDAPTNTPTRVSGGCYVINPSAGTRPPCDPSCTPVAVQVETWTGIRTLYR